MVIKPGTPTFDNIFLSFRDRANIVSIRPPYSYYIVRKLSQLVNMIATCDRWSKMTIFFPVTIIQLTETCIVICRG